MPQRSTFENAWHPKCLMLVILSACLVACAGGRSTATSGVVVTDAIRPSPSPETRTTPTPTTVTTRPPLPTNTPTLEAPTETPLPTETPSLTPKPWPTSETYFDGARVTFIDNAGFLITVGDKKILIDVLYDIYHPNMDPPQEVLQRAVNAEPPFDQIDLLIATHSHPDHFSADLVRAHLRNNEQAIFVSSLDAVRQIKRLGDNYDERLISVDLEPGGSSHLTVNGNDLDCLYISHGSPSIQNIGVVITIDDYTFFHSGDMSADTTLEEAVRLADLQGYGLPQKEIDLAILPINIFSLDEHIPLIEDGIQARFVSPMHYPYQYPPTSVEENFSNAVVFKDTLESWIVPIE